MLAVWLWNFLAKEYLRKSCSKIVGEIDYSSQFRQHFAKRYCANFLAPKIIKPNCNYRNAAQTHFYKKACGNSPLEWASNS
jgi:hypothetical protein